MGNDRAITDPRTTVASRRGGILVVLLVAAVEMAIKTLRARRRVEVAEPQGT